MNTRAMDRVIEFLKPEHFAIPANAQVYDHMVTLTDRSQPINPMTMKGPIQGDPDIDEAGGLTYIVGLAASAVTIVNVTDYGKLIYDLYLRGELIAIGEDMVNASFESTLDDTAQTLVENAESQLFSISQGNSQDSRMVGVGVAVNEAMDQIHAAYTRDEPIGVKTGNAVLDGLTGGFRDTDLIILAGRPSMGKTALGLLWYLEAARAEGDNHQSVLFTAEMSRDQLGTRLACMESGVSSIRARNGKLDMIEYEDLMRAKSELSGYPLMLDDSVGLNTSIIRSRLRRIKRRQGLTIGVIDYLQLLSPTKAERHESRSVEVGNMSKSLKEIAKELAIPLVVLSQLSRAVENRNDKRPQLSDLRESGNIEQDADQVIFLYREGYYHARNKPARMNFKDEGAFAVAEANWLDVSERVQGTAEIILAKNRHGPIGMAKASFDESCVRFGNPLE